MGVLREKTQDLVFSQVHGKRLIYNTCWEDPRIDRQLLDFDEDSEVVMITSAGCNALDYALDRPQAIHAIDMNYRQNALLQFKLALIERGDYAAMADLFINGSHRDYQAIYNDIRPLLPDYAQGYWDKKIKYFSPDNKRKSFYFHGASGDAAWWFNKCWSYIGGATDVAMRFVNAQSLAEQFEIYEEVESVLWNRVTRWLIKQPFFLTFLGVPRPQLDLINASYPDGMFGYSRDHFRTMATEVEMKDNYFWRVYITGSYTKECSPNYLKEEHFETLQDQHQAIHTHTCTISDFLRDHPGNYSHFILLDHQDWLAWNDFDALCEEWELILENSQPGSKILMRSAGSANMDFLPQFVKESVMFFPELTEPLHRTDRVGTYRSLHLAEVL